MKLFDVYPLFDLTPVRGQGCYVYDENGQEYLDFYGGHAVISIGHSHPHYVEKITKQVQQLAFYSNSIKNPLQVEYAEKLGKLSGLEDYQLFLCNSGAEANENALKMASFANGRTKIIALQKAFHGRTSSAVNVTDKEAIKAPINKTFEAEFHTQNNLKSIEKSLQNEDVCAVIIEGIQGIGGIHVAQPAYLEAVAELCKKHGTILIMDEIQAGFGRSGKFFSYQYANIEPDIISMAKGMGNGFPIGGILIHPKHQPKYGLLGTTFGGNHLACAAGTAVLEVLAKENLIENAATVGAYLIEQLKQIEGPIEVRGRGLMIGLEFPFPVGALRKYMLFEEKLFTGSSSEKNTMRLLPPLNITKKEADIFVKKLTAALNETHSHIEHIA